MYLYTCWYLVYCKSFICTYIPAGIYSKSIVYCRSIICTYIPAGIYFKSIVYCRSFICTYISAGEQHFCLVSMQAFCSIFNLMKIFFWNVIHVFNSPICIAKDIPMSTQ